ncbi:MAG: hypothetical protein WCK27_21250 [Verrucomicrobiota bacterium]
MDAYICGCDAVVHVIGEGAGAIADPNAVASFLGSEQSFIQKMKGVGDFENLKVSYTHWEAFLAAYRGKPLFVYQATRPIRDGHPTEACGFDKDWPEFQPKDGDSELVRQHCERLERLRPRRYLSKFIDRAQLYLKFGADLQKILGPKVNTSIALHERFGAHKVNELKTLLRTTGAPLLDEGFVLAAFVQIADEIPEVVGKTRIADLPLVNILAERGSPHHLLALVLSCEMRSRALGLERLSSALTAWLTAALGTLNETQTPTGPQSPLGPNKHFTEDDVRTECAEAFEALFQGPDTFPKPTLEIAWQQDAVAPAKYVIPEAYVRWGQYCKPASLGTLVSVLVDEGPTCIVRAIRNSKQLQYVRFDRLDIFVSEEELNRPWEYAGGCKPNDECARLLPWPTVVRLLGRELRFGEIKPPPDPVRRQHLACRLGQCDAFIDEVRELGAFFATRARDEDTASLLARAAALASLGFWIRTTSPVELAEECLDALEGVAFTAIPLRVFERKFASPKQSVWREISVLYDRPEWDVFKFSADQGELSDHVQMLHCHG